MKNTKSRILDTARIMFNIHGYSNVTIRMIASEMGISSGNLNYHYKTREEILESLYFEMVDVFDQRVNALGEEQITFGSIERDITNSLQRMVDYKFIWTDLFNLTRLNKEIRSHFEIAQGKRKQGYSFLLKYLKEKGWLRDSEYEKEHVFLADIMIGFSNTWIYNSAVYSNKLDSEYLATQTRMMLSMLYPYLTEVGKEHMKVETSTWES
ncbi:MAG: TetR family transcriptional regulator [Flavobacteriales bacterium]|nr:TetR family transcriptional regulator [Flavobacteriales bacterium]